MKKTKRSLQAENTRALLLETARQQMQQMGVDKVTIQSITQACGLSKGLFYHYFRSKDELLLLLERENYIQLADQIQNTCDTFYDKLHYYIVHRLALMGANDPGFSRHWITYALSDDYYEKHGQDTKVNFDFAEIASILENGVIDGYLHPDAPVMFLARMINFTLYGTTLCYRINHGGMDLPQWGEDFSHYIIRTSLLPQYGTEKLYQALLSQKSTSKP